MKSGGEVANPEPEEGQKPRPEEEADDPTCKLLLVFYFFYEPQSLRVLFSLGRRLDQLELASEGD